MPINKQLIVTGDGFTCEVVRIFHSSSAQRQNKLTGNGTVIEAKITNGSIVFGQEITLVNGTKRFNDKVFNMEINKKPVSKATEGQEIGINILDTKYCHLRY